jgi:hypothetical protein
MTYINTLLIIEIIIFLVPCNQVPTVATASTAFSMLPVQATAFSISQQDTIMNLTLDFALTACIIAIVVIYLWKISFRQKK